MPLYTYRCPECRSEKEVQHLMSEDPIIECPRAYTEDKRGQCGFYEQDYINHGEDYFEPSLMQRVITPDCANFILQGAGYYSTDARKITTPSDVHGSGIQTDPKGKAI